MPGPVEDAVQCLRDIVAALDANTPGKLINIADDLKDAIRAGSDEEVAAHAREFCEDVVDKHVPLILRERIREKLNKACTIPPHPVSLRSIVSLSPEEQEQKMKNLIETVVNNDMDQMGDVDKKGRPTAWGDIQAAVKLVSPMGIDDEMFRELVADKRKAEEQAGMERYAKMCRGECEGEITLEELMASLRWITGQEKYKIPPEKAVNSVFTAEARAKTDPVMALKAHKVSNIPEETLASAALGWVLRHDGKFYQAESGTAHLFIDKRAMLLDRSNSTFATWLAQKSGLSSETFSAKVVIALFRAYAETHGARIKTPASSCAIGDSVYLHPQLNRDDRILKIQPDNIELVDNGTDNVVLVPREEINSFSLIEDQKKLTQAPKKLKEFFLDRLPVSPPERLLVLCYTAAALLRDHAKVHPALHVTGETDKGKTSVAMFMTKLLYGEETQNVATAAACYSLAAQLPMLVLDNMEEGNTSEAVRLFLLVAVTRAARAKRSLQTNSGVIQEKPNTMVVLTAIEPQSILEIRNRFFKITASDKFWKNSDKPLAQGAILNDLSEIRDEVFSWLLYILATRILPKYKEKWRNMLNRIQDIIPKGGRIRGDEYMAIMGLWLYALAPELGYDANEILRAWVVEQAGTSEADQAEDSICAMATAAILTDLDIGYEKMMDSKAIRRGIASFYGKGQQGNKIIGFKASLGQFVLAAGDLIPRFPYKTPGQLKSRFANEKKAMEKQGWTIETVFGEDNKPKHTREGNLYKFTNSNVDSDAELASDLDRVENAPSPGPEPDFSNLN